MSSDLIYGFNGKYLDIDLSSGRSKEVRIPKYVLRRFLGGRGLGTYILWRELGRRWGEVDPLSPDNLLVLVTGPLTGYFPGGNKLVVTGKSPLSNGVVGSAVSTDLSVELKACGYDAVVIRGASKDPTYLLITDDGAELRDASKLWGLKSSEFLLALKEELKDVVKGGLSTLPTIYIGPAGESLVRVAAVMSRLTHAAGYGGYGAVMGSKKLKAVVAISRKPLPKVANTSKVKELWFKVIKVVSERTLELRRWGTSPAIWRVGAVTSSEPIRNWREEWHDVKELSHSIFSAFWVKRVWSDWSCPIGCMKLCRVVIDEETYLTDGPDYELGAYLGTNLGVFKPEEIIALSSLIDELGLCGIQAGNTLALVIELMEEGIIREDELGFKVSWGDFKGITKLIELMVRREGLGDLIAEGTYRLAKELSRIKGKDLMKYAVQVKGIAVGAHGVRSGKDYPQPIAYAASVQGGDHTSVAGLPLKSRESETWRVFVDSLGACMFVTYQLSDEELIEYLNAVTGWLVSKDEVYEEIAPRVLTLQRILLLIGGPDIKWDPRVDDDNPPRFYKPLPTGPYKGSTVKREEVKSKLREYYLSLGWDEYGIPTEETLRKLGLEDTIDLVKNIRIRLINY